MQHSQPPDDNLDEDEVAILIVDDRAEDLRALSAVLASPLQRVVTAQSGSEALRRILERDFAVVLLDVRMPIMDGFELAALVKQRERSKHTPIIFLTAAAPDFDRIFRGYSVGAVDYLTKPVTPDVVRAKVAVFADLFRKGRRLARQSAALREAERRERELQIAELKLNAERRYVNLAEAIPQIVWTASSAGDWYYVNRRWLDYTGLAADSANGLSWLSALHPDDRERCKDEWLSAVATSAVFEFECRLRRGADGAHRWHLCRAIPEFSDGQVVAWLGTFTDFEGLKQAINARDDFLSIASHELRTPLTALKLRLESLQQSLASDEHWRPRVTGAARQCERLERLIDDLLDVSRITTGHFKLDRSSCDLHAIVKEVIERFSDEARAAGSALELVANGNLQGAWDRLRVEQLITNLVSNAIKYGSGQPIQIGLRGNQAGVELSIRDRGIGIEPANLERIFERFERVAEPREYAGLGMGLYIAREIALAHGGAIQVESTPGSGSVFRVALPRA